MPVSDPILVFAILALAIMAAPLLANKLRVPDLVLLLIAGAALGPKGFGVLERNTAIELFGAVGLIYIMFLAGIEIDLTRFMRTRGRSIFFGLMTFSIPQGLGTLAGRYILHMDWPASILLASMFASHTLLAYPLASRLGISRTEPVAVTVGATIITDTLALLVLAVIADSARGITLGFGFWAGIVLGMTALVLLIWWGIPWLSRWFFKNFTEAGGAQFLFVLFVVCGCSYLSHFARMEPIIGAFLAGAAFNRQIPENSALMNRVVFAGNTLFIPFFLISVGMLVDPMALVNNPRSWIVVITMTAAVIVTKYMAAWVSRRKFGYGADAGKVMFGLSVVQAAATLAAVLVGYNLKIFDESVLNGAIGMILVTCPLGAWYVDRYGRKMAAEVQIAKEPERIEQRIVVPVAKPDSAVRLLDLAFLFRNHEIPGTIYPMTVVSDEADPDESLARAENLLALCVTHAASAEVNLNPIVRVDINVSDGISRAAKEMRAGMVLSGWSGDQKAGARIFGTVMSNLKTNCPSRLILGRIPQPLNTTRRLLLILPPLAERWNELSIMLQEARHFSRQVGAELRVYLAGTAADELRKRIENLQPECAQIFIQTEDWNTLRARILGDILPDDMVFLLLERKNAVLWTPTFDRLPDQIALKFPQVNLLAEYPSMSTAGDVASVLSGPVPASFPILFSTEFKQESGLEDALTLMADNAFSSDPEARESALTLLLSSSRLYPIELLPGVVLFHAHCDRINTPVLLVGFGKKGWPMPNMKTAPHILLALLSPKSDSPETHLKTLAGLARRFNNPAIADRIRNASSAYEICTILRG